MSYISLFLGCCFLYLLYQIHIFKFQILEGFLEFYEYIKESFAGYKLRRIGNSIMLDMGNRKVFFPYKTNIFIATKDHSMHALYSNEKVKIDITPFEGTAFDLSPKDIGASKILVTDSLGKVTTYTKEEKVKWGLKEVEIEE
jgi:hypothetical protein